MKLGFRSANENSDRNFVISTWSSSYKSSHYAGLIQSDDWSDIMRPQFGKVLDRQGARAIIAHEADDPAFFYGWIAGDTTESAPVIYYVYVKEPYRRNGVARDLFRAIGVDPVQRFVYPCRTRIVTQLASKIPAARYDNLQARYPKTERRRRL